MGPAKHAVIAMFDKPFFAIVTFVAKSPTELPQARTVRPIIELGIRQTIPRNVRTLTRLFAITSIHNAARTSPYNAIGPC